MIQSAPPLIAEFGSGKLVSLKRPYHLHLGARFERAGLDPAMVACRRAAGAFPYRTHSKTAPFNRTHRQARHARSTLRDPKCDLPHAAASETRVGSPCPPHLVPAGGRSRRRGTMECEMIKPVTATCLMMGVVFGVATHASAAPPIPLHFAPHV